MKARRAAASRGDARAAASRGDASKKPKASAQAPRVALPKRKKRVKRTRAKLKKGLWGGGGPPFGREFFAETLAAMVDKCPCAAGHAPVVHVHLGDGAILDVAGVVALHERYAVVAAFEGTGQDGIERTADDLGFEAFPYDLVVRTTVRAAPARSSRFGFGAFSAAGPTPGPASGDSAS